jgi:DNA-binding NarL/FixJ family response regulator
MIRVALVDDHALIRDGVRRNLERDSEIHIVAEAASIAEARAAIAHRHPDVVVLDIRLGDGSGLDLCRELASKSPAPAVVVLSMYAEPARVEAAQRAGASAFVGKDAPASKLSATVRAVAAGQQSFPTRDPRELGSGVPSLTPREHEVLQLLADGLGVSLISKRLFISESTTKTHVAKIYAKLGATNRAQALMTAIREGLILGNGADF